MNGRMDLAAAERPQRARTTGAFGLNNIEYTSIELLRGESELGIDVLVTPTKWRPLSREADEFVVVGPTRANRCLPFVSIRF